MASLTNRVIFSKPNIAALKADGYSCVDMHIHTKYTDGRSSVKAIAKKAMKLGIGVSITDHNFILGSLEISKQPDVFSIPGIEVEAAEGCHILFYFYTVPELIRFYKGAIIPGKSRFHSRTPLKKTTVSIMDESSDYGCIMVAAHPYGIAWQGIAKRYHKGFVDESLLKRFDCFEVISGEITRHRNLKAIALAEKLNKGITAGSDAHSIRQLGTVLTCAKDADDIDSFLNAIKQNRAIVIGREISLLQKYTSIVMKFKMAPLHPFPYLKKGVSYAANRSGNNTLGKGVLKVKQRILRRGTIR